MHPKGTCFTAPTSARRFFPRIIKIKDARAQEPAFAFLSSVISRLRFSEPSGRRQSAPLSLARGYAGKLRHLRAPQIRACAYI